MSIDSITRIAGMEREVADLGTIVAVFAHPDDETYIAGGLMALARRSGQPRRARHRNEGRARHRRPAAVPAPAARRDPRARARRRDVGARCARAPVVGLRRRLARRGPVHARDGARAAGAGRGPPRHGGHVRARRHDRSRRPSRRLAVGNRGLGVDRAERRGCSTAPSRPSSRSGSRPRSPASVCTAGARHRQRPRRRRDSRSSSSCRASCSTGSTGRCARCRARRPR